MLSSLLDGTLPFCENFPVGELTTKYREFSVWVSVAKLRLRGGGSSPLREANPGSEKSQGKIDRSADASEASHWLLSPSEKAKAQNRPVTGGTSALAVVGPLSMARSGNGGLP